MKKKSKIEQESPTRRQITANAGRVTLNNNIKTFLSHLPTQTKGITDRVRDRYPESRIEKGSLHQPATVYQEK